ncbi:MAG: SDR family oxidoreductase [Bacteroidota bacterium]
MTLKNKVAIVTGSSMGIGKAISHALGSAGCKVVLNGRTQDRLHSAAAEMESQGYEVYPIAADVSNWEDCERLVEECIAHFGRLDILINNAGAATRGPVEDLKPEVFQKITNINLLGSIFPSKAALSALKESKGSIIYISSIASFYGIPYNSIYSATKKALTAFAESLRIETRHQGIHVGIAYVGFTENDPKKIILDSDGQRIYLENREGVKKQSPEKVAGVILNMIRQRKSSHTLSLPGKGLKFIAKFAPFLIKFIYQKNLGTIKEASSGTPRYVDT